MNPMAIGEPRRALGRYVRRPVEGHGVVRAVWVREAGVFTGSPLYVVARTFPSVVLHLDDDVERVDVETRRSGRCSPGVLSRRAVGFDAHPWTSPEELAALAAAVRGARPGVPLDQLVRSVLSQCDTFLRHDVVSELATALERAPDRSTMLAVAEQATSSRRTLRRRFAAIVGMSADRYRVVARASLARHLLVTTSTPLATLAHELGYADQSHLHRDLLELSGTTPSAWRARRSAWRVS